MSFVDQILTEAGADPKAPLSLYALLDAARESRVVSLLLGVPETSRSLYEGAQAEELAPHAPYLVELPGDSPLLEKLADEAFGRSYCVWLTSRASFDDVRKHLRHFLMVKTEDDKEVYFRFYDPRVLRVFLPTCTREEVREFFGPIRSFWVEGREPGVISRFFLSEGGVLRGERLTVSGQEAQDAR